MLGPAPGPAVFLCGHRKSGTTLLANLLDGHPELDVYPNDLMLLYAYFPHFVTEHPDPAERRARLKKVLFTDLAERFARLDPPPGLDVEALENAFFDGLKDAELDDPAVLIARLLAAYRELGETGTRQVRRAVVKETSIEIYAAEILEWFPEARFVQILRDPRDNFAALAAGVEAHYGRLGEDRRRTLASLLHRARLGFAMAAHNMAALGPERYHFLRFEDLAGEPRRAMEALAGFLGVGFDSCLLTPTLLGLPAGGNSYDGEEKFTVDLRNVDRWRERITDDEARVIEFHMRAEMAEFGYAPAFTPAEQAAAASAYYKWQNYAYFYGDRFADKASA